MAIRRRDRQWDSRTQFVPARPSNAAQAAVDRRHLLIEIDRLKAELAEAQSAYETPFEQS